jgi:4-hydroxy-tetrahydrodipicolinate reductase
VKSCASRASIRASPSSRRSSNRTRKQRICRASPARHRSTRTSRPPCSWTSALPTRSTLRSHSQAHAASHSSAARPVSRRNSTTRYATPPRPSPCSGAPTSASASPCSRASHAKPRALASWDCEIAEAHHRNKKDAPSGTALALGRAVADARGVAFDEVAERDRSTTPRTRAESIGFAITRAGDIVGEHTVTLAGEGERIELTHRATDRAIFARGAIEAAIWVAAQRPGAYALADMLGLGRD